MFNEMRSIGKFVNHIDNEGNLTIDLESKEISIEFEKPVKTKIFLEHMKKILFLIKTFMAIKPN